MLICDAPCIDNAGFDNSEDGRIHAKKRRNHLKAKAAEREAHAALSAQQLSDVLYKGELDSVPELPPMRPSVPRLITTRSSQAAAMPVDAISDEAFADNFSKNLARMTGGASILEFPQGNGPAGTASGRQHEPKSSAYGSGKKKGGKNPAR